MKRRIRRDILGVAGYWGRAGLLAVLCLCFAKAGYGGVSGEAAIADGGHQLDVTQMKSAPHRGSYVERGVFAPIEQMTLYETKIGTGSYEKVDGKGTRFYRRAKQTGSWGHVWHLKPVDLRERTVRVYYSGIPPAKIVFQLYRSRTSRKLEKEFECEAGSASKMIEFEVPDEYPFRDVSNFVMRMEGVESRHLSADFYIERIEVGVGPDGTGLGAFTPVPLIPTPEA